MQFNGVPKHDKIAVLDESSSIQRVKDTHRVLRMFITLLVCL